MARFATDANGVVLGLRKMELAVRLSMLMVDKMESVLRVSSLCIKGYFDRRELDYLFLLFF